MSARKPTGTTGPLPDFETNAPLSAHTLKSAWMYLDDMRGNVSPQNMIDNVAIQYGITPERARDVYEEWLKVQ
jgi:hypothetical protein